jgi:hypothetical protein
MDREKKGNIFHFTSPDLNCGPLDLKKVWATNSAMPLLFQLYYLNLSRFQAL